MILKEFERIEMDILTVLGKVRSEIRMQVLKFPGAAAHRLKPASRPVSRGPVEKRNK